MEEETLNMRKVKEAYLYDKRKNKTMCTGEVEKFEIVEMDKTTSNVYFHLNTGYRVCLVVQEEK